MKEFLIGDSVEIFYGDKDDYRYNSRIKGFVISARNLEPLGKSVVYYLVSKSILSFRRISIGKNFNNTISTSRMVLIEKIINNR
jgi:hypothetical protein